MPRYMVQAAYTTEAAAAFASKPQDRVAGLRDSGDVWITFPYDATFITVLKNRVPVRCREW